VSVTDSPAHVQHTAFRSSFGNFQLWAYEFPDGSEHAALAYGDVRQQPNLLVRVQSACLTGTAFGALLCDCRQQFELSLDHITANGSGIALYMDQEGRGYGLVEKVRQLAVIASGEANTATAARDPEADRRTYDHAFHMLRDLAGVTDIRLLTNNPKKIRAFESNGYSVQRVALESAPTDSNREYLRIKKQFMGHLLSCV
jgi:GTP cyclohydrolase II